MPGFFRTGWRPNQGGAYSHSLSPLVASALGFPGYVEGSGDVILVVILVVVVVVVAVVRVVVVVAVVVE